MPVNSCRHQRIQPHWREHGYAQPDYGCGQRDALQRHAGEKNAVSSLQNVVATRLLLRDHSDYKFWTGCATVTGYTSGVNAVKVVQTASVPLWFGGMFHVPSFNIAATASASMAGGPKNHGMLQSLWMQRAR